MLELPFYPHEDGNQKETNSLMRELPVYGEDEFSECDCEEASRNFASVLAAIDCKRVPRYVLSVRQGVDPNYTGEAPASSGPTYSGNNVCFTLTFDDGNKVVPTIPTLGYRGEMGRHVGPHAYGRGEDDDVLEERDYHSGSRGD